MNFFLEHFIEYVVLRKGDQTFYYNLFVCSVIVQKLFLNSTIVRVISKLSEIRHCHRMGKVCPSVIPNSPYSSTVTLIKFNSFGTTELYNSTKKRKHYFDILKAFFSSSDTHPSIKLRIVTERLTKV